MPRHRVRCACPAVLLLLTACGPTEAEPVPPRLVVLYAPCSLNRDFLEPYGALAGSTPNLASFASEGAVFERHQTEAGQSGSAYASLFAGTQAYLHGVLHHPTILSGDLTLVTEVFAGAGYQTWFWSGQPMGGASPTRPCSGPRSATATATTCCAATSTAPGGSRVYDLARDPGLTQDLFEAGDVGQAAVRAQLEEYRASIVERYERAAQDPLGNLSVEEQTEHLRELGYVR